MKDKILKIFVLLFSSILFISCASSEDLSRSENQIKDLDSKVNSLQQEVAFLKGKIESIEKILMNINNQIIQLQLMPNMVTPDNTSTEQDLLNLKTNTNSKTKTSIDKKSSSETSSGRCQAITQKGTQCKRNAKPGSKYCWQHQK
ncbi:MAG: hypothetical protein A2315_04855 [Ignavibacteria bacterium RIFOXYB2_FULL_35_12]|nr:MAG: hypothetical protein A2058_15730 [Ignavibacteria bacterium GWA2_36_19]OGU50326.1 MAG: hypothetical protein A2006_07710 [Ignavibacteria bacterium GWC2_35_8]OGU62606.1 MAG: hypothetical protein A2X60_07995 [Ignavibacteria bacterium GWF2_35_20]OGU80103.1 MAG: hypothetical protein A2254_11170 [Ignavibacteria bacterium RIFOXYA2_FULL_35_9]OGU89647.1 MAG: hypothetical protein A3K31_15805 [Ignavibacteria bacterium RIFOXYA12_FULL_35_25]OGU94657.1 MAG: hypothetical protein A2347_03355 [Ignavibac